MVFAVGKKVLDKSIDPDEVLKGTLVSGTIINRNQMPIWIDLAEDINFPEI